MGRESGKPPKGLSVYTRQNHPLAQVVLLGKYNRLRVLLTEDLQPHVSITVAVEI